MPKKGEFIVDINAEALKRGLTQIALSKVEEIRQAVKDTAHAAYASIIAKAQSKLTSTRRDYLSGLQFETISPDNYVIYLDGNWPNGIEDGWAPYDMKQQLLKSRKVVTQGSRAGQPWVQKGKKQQRYAHVPFEHGTGNGASGASDLAGVIKNLKAHNLKTGKMQRMGSTFKDASGKVLQGKVATFRYPPEEAAMGLSHPRLEGVTKYQKTVKNLQGKMRTKSLYVTYRTISDLSPSNKWQNKGFAGLNAFSDAEKYVESEIENIIRTILD